MVVVAIDLLSTISLGQLLLFSSCMNIAMVMVVLMLSWPLSLSMDTVIVGITVTFSPCMCDSLHRLGMGLLVLFIDAGNWYLILVPLLLMVAIIIAVVPIPVSSALVCN